MSHSIPFFSVFWGVLWLNEPLNVAILIGLVVILASVWLVLSEK